MHSPTPFSRSAGILTFSLLLAWPAYAETPPQLLRQYEAAARQDESAFQANAARGEAFYRTRQPASTTGKATTACAGCHSPDPRQLGRTRANKQIEPLAPAANPERFTDRAKVEKWFGRNCGDTFGRDCTPAEKADFIAWLANLR